MSIRASTSWPRISRSVAGPAERSASSKAPPTTCASTSASSARTEVGAPAGPAKSPRMVNVSASSPHPASASTITV
jgi:hypothetical protein